MRQSMNKAAQALADEMGLNKKDTASASTSNVATENLCNERKENGVEGNLRAKRAVENKEEFV